MISLQYICFSSCRAYTIRLEIEASHPGSLEVVKNKWLLFDRLPEEPNRPPGRSLSIDPAHFNPPDFPPRQPSMSVLLQLQIFATLCTVSGAALLIKPELLLRSPIDDIIVRLTGLPSSSVDPVVLAPAAIPICAIGYIYWAAIWSGDDKLVRFSVPGRLFFAAISAYLLVLTNRGSTGLFIMFVCDLAFALWLGFTIGFGGVERGSLKDLTKKRQ